MDTPYGSDIGSESQFHHMLSTSSFYKVFHNDQTAQCGINHMYTVVSQKMQHMSLAQLQYTK